MINTMKGNMIACKYVKLTEEMALRPE